LTPIANSPLSLADSYARAGYLTIIPDLFDGNPAPEDLNDPNFNATEFFMLHNPGTIDPKIAKAINYLRVNKNISKIGAPGYCFGGRYSFRFAGASGVASGPSNAFIDAAFAAHPSLLEDEEIEAIGAPAAIAAAEDDPLFADAARLNAEVLLRGTNQPYRTTLYSGTHHGFGVRVDLSDDEQREGKEDAFLQAVAWFDRYLI
jgi:dienelactone hydrolase